MIAPIQSLAQLRSLAFRNEAYKRLALIAANNLGAGREITDINAAMEWLNINADETDEQGVVEEVNFCRELVGQ
jgi:hypothetical protein